MNAKLCGLILQRHVPAKPIEPRIIALDHDTSPAIKDTMKHVAAYGLIFLGILLLVGAAHDEHRGVAVVTAPGGINSDMFTRRIAKRDDDPQGFRNLILYEWIEASLFLCAGFIALGISQRVERSDPLSEDFAGNSAIDELNDELAKEQEKRRRPLR